MTNSPPPARHGSLPRQWAILCAAVFGMTTLLGCPAQNSPAPVKPDVAPPAVSPPDVAPPAVDPPAVNPPAQTSQNPGGGYGGYGAYGGYGGYGSAEIKFLDDAPSNAATEQQVVEIEFQDPAGKSHKVGEYAGEKSRHIVLVVTRGNTLEICPFCTTQTARLIKRYPELQQHGAEVVLVYPVQKLEDRSKLDGFLAATRKQLDNSPAPLPFPVLLDLELKGVNQLGIRRDLSKPATYIIDKTGKVRYAYVGADNADRPSVDAVLKELDKLNAAS